MKKSSLQNHYNNQISFFGKEFLKIDKYKLKEWQKSYIKKIKKYLLDKDFKGKTLIDIGTGEGYVAIEMAKIGMSVIACDLTTESLSNIERFKKKFKLKNIKLINCKAESIPAKDKSVDYVVANAILEHIPFEQKAISEWKRILKDDGKIFITVPIEYKSTWFFLWPLIYYHDRRLGHLRRYNAGMIEKKFNMKIVKKFYTGNIIKFIGFVIIFFTKNTSWEKKIEKLDEKTQNIPFGAQNVIAILARK